MDYTKEMWFVISFHCVRCNSPVIFRESDVRDYSTNELAVCGNCGAPYVYFGMGDTLIIERTTYGEMYMPPLEWNELFRQGQDSGMAHETARRRNQSLWDRLWTFIHNE